MHRRVQGQECNLQEPTQWHGTMKPDAAQCGWMTQPSTKGSEPALGEQRARRVQFWEINLQVLAGEVLGLHCHCINVMGTGSTSVDDTTIKHDKKCCARSSAQETTSPAN